MIKTVSKNVGKGWAVFAGLFFLACAALKFASCILPSFAGLFAESGIVFSAYFPFDVLEVVEVLAYFSLALLSFSCQRVNTALIPISSLAFLLLYQASERIWWIIFSVKFSHQPVGVFAEILIALYVVCTFASLFFVMLEINVNVSAEKGKVTMKLFAILAIVLYFVGYGAYLIGDILEFFTSSRFATFMETPDGILSQLVIPIVDNVKQLFSCGGFLFLCIWMAIRAKVIEVFVKDKITDEDLFKDVVADPNMIKKSEEPEVEEPVAPVADAEATVEAK